MGAGSFAPKPEKISPNVGTTLTSRKQVIVTATMVTMVGYIIADLTFFCRRTVFSK